MKLQNLGIVIPVYNERANINKVLKSWDNEIRRLNLENYKFLVINDGSTDGTLEEINQLNHDKIEIYSIKNQGHGGACLFGYKIAIKKKFDWILQIDSDGQCNPTFFEKFVNLSDKNEIIFGYRSIRRDGYLRLIFSKILSILIFLKSSLYIKDANVPYRLMKLDHLKEVVQNIPPGVLLKNVSLAVELKKRFKQILFIPIIFEERFSGKSKHNFLSMFKQIINLLIKI